MLILYIHIKPPMNNYFKRVSRSTSDFIYIMKFLLHLNINLRFVSQIVNLKFIFYLNDWFIYKYTIFKTFSEIIIVYNLI